MEAEVVESAMRPGAMRAITKRHERSEKEIQSDCANSHEADIGGKVEDGCAHGQRETGIGVQTARHGLTFQGKLWD